MPVWDGDILAEPALVTGWSTKQRQEATGRAPLKKKTHGLHVEKSNSQPLNMPRRNRSERMALIEVRSLQY
jgi:hypothetical protein